MNYNNMEDNNTNIQNQEGKITYNNFQKPDYYTTTGKKVGDFILGFFGIIILNFIFGAVLYPLFSLANSGWANLFISIVALVLFSVLFFKIGRRFIAVGIISMALIPILIFGSCLLLLGG
jgi:hypothetical protein